MSTFTPEQLQELEAIKTDAVAAATSAAAKVAASYKAGDSAWQKLRREHPLAVQNVLGWLIPLAFIAGWFARGLRG